MIKISHEIPKQLFPFHDLINDYPYVLGHLLMEGTKYFDKEYADFYRKKISESEYSILDNGAFELGHPVENDVLYKLCEEYKPHTLVLPDHFFDSDKTIKAAKEFYNHYTGSSELMIVLQGRDFDELMSCFDGAVNLGFIDKIAISFGIFKEPYLRFLFIKRLIEERSAELKHHSLHLLGCRNPSEFRLYKGMEIYIASVDTSSPIVNGWSGNELTQYGLMNEKPKELLAENLDISLNQDQLFLIVKNIKTFRSYFA